MQDKKILRAKQAENNSSMLLLQANSKQAGQDHGTYGIAEHFQVFFQLKWHHKMFVSQYRVTKTILYLSYKTRFLNSLYINQEIMPKMKITLAVSLSHKYCLKQHMFTQNLHLILHPYES